MHTALGRGLFKCAECGTIRPADIKTAKPLKIKLIISQLDTSRRGCIEIKKNEQVKLGDEFAVEEGDEVGTVKITAIETIAGKRAKVAKGEEIACLWGKIVSEVNVKIAVQEKGITRSQEITADGDREFSVGGIEKIAGEAVEITAIKIKEGRMKKREGDTAPAKDIKRIFSRPFKEIRVNERSSRAVIRNRRS